MKNSIPITLTRAVGALCLLALTTQLSAQTSAFTYQGALSQNGQPANGTYDFMFRLLDAETDGTAAPVIPLNPGVGVTNGLFTTGINFDAENLNGANLWLEISVRTNGGGAFTTLAPRQLLTSAPYAVRAANVSAGGISGTYGNAVTFNNAANSFTGNGAGLISLNATALSQGTVPPAALDNAWKIGGNTGTTAGTHFIGTLDHQPVEIRVNSVRAMRIEENGDSSDAGFEPDQAPNIIAGSPANEVGEGLFGVTISGGGVVGYQGVYFLPNIALADFAVISGGMGNFVGTNSTATTLSGGSSCQVEGNAPYSVIGGGYANGVGPESGYGVIGGGIFNGIGDSSKYSFTGGGEMNRIGSNSSYGTLGGGYRNSVGDNSSYVSMLGGRSNEIATNSWYSVIVGGFFNTIGATCYNATIAGGVLNSIQTNSSHSAIGGGAKNSINQGSPYSVVSGGELNVIGTNSPHCSIGGGLANRVENNAPYAMIPGGWYNAATNYGFAGGRQAKAIHTGAFVWGDSSPSDIASVDRNSVTFRASGGFRLFSNSDATAGVSLAPNATAWSVISDRAVKKDFAAVDSREVLEKLAAVPVQSWHYQWESADATPHLGPVAQDFKAAFYPGRDDQSITTLEFDGVALAAIQGLNQKLEARSQESDARSRLIERRLEEELYRRDAENAELRRQNAELLRRLEAIEARIK